MKINEAKSKIRNSHFGKKSKKLLNEWINHESIGGVGMGPIKRHVFYERAKIPMPLYVLQLKGDHMAVLSLQKMLLVLMDKSFS